MIIIRKFKNNDLENLRELIEELKIEVKSPSIDDLIYLSFEDDKLIGAVKADEEKGVWNLNYIYIHRDFRNTKIGDGLLRVVIDNLERQGVKSLYFSNIDHYLMKRGFKENKENILELDVENFFNHKCSCGIKDEV